MDVTRGCARCGDRQLLFDWNIFRKDRPKRPILTSFSIVLLVSISGTRS